MAEQLAGQIFRSTNAAYIDPAHFYWHREKPNSSAEVDYVIQHENQVIPVEIKTGTTGSLKSLREFIKEKKSSLAVRVNSDKPSVVIAQIVDPSISHQQYKLISLPFFYSDRLIGLLKPQLSKRGQPLLLYGYPYMGQKKLIYIIKFFKICSIQI